MIRSRSERLRQVMKVPSLHTQAGKIRPGSRFVCQVFVYLLNGAMFCPGLSLAQQTSAPAPAVGVRILHGLVKSRNMPIPGASVTAANALTKQQINTSTNVDGTYRLIIPADGRYTVQVQMAAFAAGKQEVLFDTAHQDIQANFELVLLSRVRQAATEQRQATAGRRGFQNLSVFQSGSGQDASNGSMSDVVPSGMPVPGISSDSATESVAIAGNTSNSFNAMSADEMQQRFNDARQQGGGFGGGGFGGPGGGRGGGFGGGGGGGGPMIFGRRGFDSNRPHGSLYYGVGDSALNASPFSLTGQPTEKPSYLQNSFGGSVGGPLNIPHIYHGGAKTFYFINYNGKRAENPFDQFSTVPTALERQGNFSQTTYSSGAQAGPLPVRIFNPATNTQYANNTIPQINPAAQALLQYIPLPNLPGSYQNFHYVTSANSDSDDLNIRVNRSFGAAPVRGRRGGGRNAPRNNLTFGFHYHESSTTLTNPFPSVGGNTSVRSFDIPVSYTRSIGKLTNIVRADFNRSRTRTQNLYAFSNDITGALGITGVSQNPFDWGLPNLSFTNFASLQDTTPQLSRPQTYTFSDNVIWNHGKHTARWGGDFRRVQVNTDTDGNPRGSFVFSGFNTEQLDSSGNPVAGTGYDFADFLLGLPQQTSEQFGQSEHFHGNYWDLYAQDEWKMRANLTLNLGVRYEYVSPLTEENNRIANLDLSPGVLNPALGVAAVTPILPGQAGPYYGRLPASLLRPDRNNFAPRTGFAWKPFSTTVIRGGYGINYNTGAYQGIAQQLALQPPFATTATNIEPSSRPPIPTLTLQSGFPPPTGITNDYAVNPNYRLGYVQIRNLDIQQQIRPTLLLNIDYTGTKGTDLDILEAPNRNATSTAIRIAGVQAFTYESSLADSEANAGSVRLRKRLAKGFAIGGIYTFSKALDDASSIGAGATSGSNTPGLGAGGTGASGGGGGGSSSSASSGSSAGASNVAQNPFNLAAERGLSSFNQTHKFTADYLWELPFGHDKRWLTENTPWRAILGDWQWSGDWTIASGLPFTPRIVGNIGNLNAGINGTQRPDLVPGQSVSLPNPSVREWFNTAAFVLPTGPYGDARRNSIIGPGTKVFDMAFTKIIPLKESRVLEFRAQATNIFNIPNYSSIDTSVTSPTFGRVTGVGAMRAFTMTGRFRF
ncbi:MAG: TonB-dependent receptor [Candidatus Sulfotelmatobacter sp.]